MEDKLKQAISAYNKVAKIYASYNEGKLLQFELTKFESLLLGKKILDAGCGPGKDSCYFTEDGFKVVGIDASKSMIEQAKERCKKPEFIVKDLRKITYKEEFDGIWASNSLVHSNKKNAEKIISKLFQSLKKGGTLYISTKKGSGSKEIKREDYQETFTYFYYTKEEFQEMLSDAGFEIIPSTLNVEEDPAKVEFFAKKPQ